MAEKLLNRRALLAAAGGALAGSVAGAGVAAYAIKRTPSRNVGLIGAGTRGTRLISGINRLAPITAICDPDKQRLALAQDATWRGRHIKASLHQDYREILDQPDINTVLVSTCDHWHADISIAALNAGKNVYCEKPMTLTIEEGRRMIEAVRKSGRTLLVGTQQRSDPVFEKACQLIREGALGDLKRAVVKLPRVTWSPGESGPFPDETQPADLAWNIWLGQAPSVPYCPERFTNHRWFWAYNGGRLTGFGAHMLDIVHLALSPGDDIPLSIRGTAHFPESKGGFDNPDEFALDYEYPNNLQVEVRMERTPGIRPSVLFEGSKGTFYIDRDAVKGDLLIPKLPVDLVNKGKDRAWRSEAIHFQHLFNCIERGETPRSGVVSQHRTAMACHLGNIALNLGRPLRFDPATESCIDDAEANAMFTRPRRNEAEIFA